VNEIGHGEKLGMSTQGKKEQRRNGETTWRAESSRKGWTRGKNEIWGKI